jgi:predicted GIY-YIG superfamily endonuclease
MHCIYFFRHPEDNHICYIGRTNNIKHRFKKHLQHIDKYQRHPFKCLLHSLYKKGYSKEQLFRYFQVVHTNLTLNDAQQIETAYINSIGINNLKQIATDGRFGGDTFTNNPNKELIRKKYQRREPWNKGQKFPGKVNSTSFVADIPRTRYILTSPSNQVFELTGTDELRSFLDDWTTKYCTRPSYNRDVNKLSLSAFLLNDLIKGWKIDRIVL